jgi:hypothetical protein
MRTPTQSAFNMPPTAAANIPRTTVYAERAYQGVTIAAVLWLLGSLWLFR